MNGGQAGSPLIKGHCKKGCDTKLLSCIEPKWCEVTWSLSRYVLSFLFHAEVYGLLYPGCAILLGEYIYEAPVCKI